ncbi:ATP-dependent DNA helicase [Quillaja saponaria]|uniref:ATP-dependent DNA helicase n=1 Tax=Quillaja saponaria TaxID=32244 RepID=A0AAD7M3P1_QUISA|nr:ATP-dependent DNA helicase [Quillaja saponaria]
MKNESKIINPDNYDDFVAAEIPAESENPHLRKMVLKHMIHGPCGPLNASSPCMIKSSGCKSYYPKQFCSASVHGSDSYPIYRRRDTGEMVKVRGHMIDNRWVVPYNAYLLAKYDCHTNVEICSTVKAVKYLYKYIYKGHDRISFQINDVQSTETIDEIEKFRIGHWVSPQEAMWRIYGFDMNEASPSVLSLQLHLPYQHAVSYRPDDDLSYLLMSDYFKKTMLTEFFEANRSCFRQCCYLYSEFPEYFVWNKQGKFWSPRKQGKVIGIIVTASPTEGERYYLRLLLNHVKGPTSFENLRTINDVIVSSFQEAAAMYGLLQIDSNIDDCLEEASHYQMSIFSSATVCYSIVDFKVNGTDENLGGTEIENELKLPILEEDFLCIEKLNSRQKELFDNITNRVFNSQPGLYFVDGPEGTGKTFLYRALLVAVRSQGLVALATVASSVAASILPGGRTAHSRFKIPINIEEFKTCNVGKQTGIAHLMRAAKLILCDETSMSHKAIIEAVDSMLQDVCNTKQPFGGKVVVFGGDFRQVLPVVPKATKEECINASLVSSKLWPLFEKIRLTENMRALEDPSFSLYMLRIGNGTEPEHSDHKVKIPAPMIVPCIDDVASVNDLISGKSFTIHVTVY